MSSLLARISQVLEGHESLVLIGADVGAFLPEPDMIDCSQHVVLFAAPKEAAADVDQVALWLDQFDCLRPVQRFNLLSFHGLANNFGGVIFEEQIGEWVETRRCVFGEEFLTECDVPKGSGLTLAEKKIPLKRRIILRLYPSIDRAKESLIVSVVIGEAA